MLNVACWDLFFLAMCDDQEVVLSVCLRLCSCFSANMAVSVEIFMLRNMEEFLFVFLGLLEFWRYCFLTVIEGFP